MNRHVFLSNINYKTGQMVKIRYFRVLEFDQVLTNKSISADYRTSVNTSEQLCSTDWLLPKAVQNSFTCVGIIG